MGLETTTTRQDGVAIVTLVGEADASSTEQLDAALAAATAEPVRQLVLDLAGLTYLSSAGLRCLAVVHQRLGRGVSVVLADPRPGVADTIQLVGLHLSMVVRYGGAG